MGAFCSSQSHPPHTHDPPHPPLPERLPKRSSRTNQVPSLFDLCLEELCNSLCETEKEEEVPSPPISSPTSSLPSFVSYGMSRAIWPSLLGATFLRTSSIPPVRCRALSLSARHSPEMGPSSNPHPHVPRSTLTFHHRHLHLPEPIIQVIFDYMLSDRLLTLSHCTLFTRAHLSTISLGSYPGVTDDWLHLLLASVPYQTCSDTQQILTSPGRIKRQMSATRRAQPSARVSWQGQGESEEEKGLPMSVMRALTTRASIVQTTSSTSTPASAATSPRTPLLSPTQPISAASVSTRTISTPIRIAQLCGDTSPVPVGLSQSPPQQESMPTLTCLSPVSSPTSTSSDSSMGDSGSSPTSPVLSSSDSSSTSSPLSLSPFNLTSTRRISQLPSPLVTHSLTHLDVSKCQALTEYALRPLVACPALKYLNVEGCTQLSDTLFTFILRDKYDLTYLNLAGLKGVTNATLQILNDKDGIKTLILDQCTITDAGLRDLNDFHNLEHLSLGWCGQHVTHDGLYWLCNNSLTYLNIAFTGVTCASCFATSHHLTHLNVAGTKLSETHWRIPQQFPTLTHVDLQRSKLTEIPIGVLHHGLQLLDVSFTSMSAPKLAYQIASLARMKAIKIPSTDLDADSNPDMSPTPSDDTVIPLHTLRMESCSVDNAVAKSIALCTNLTELVLCDTDVTNDGVKCLTSLTNLTHLSLSGCQLTNTALIVFETLTNLKVLYLDCPTITDGGLHYLRHLHSLELLDLFETHITDMGLDHLHSLRALQHLEICSGKLTNVGLNKIAQRLINLTSLNLSQNPGITDAGVSVLSYLPSLRHINLSGTSITHKGLTFIQSLPLLAHVSLFGCKVKPMSNKIKELPRGVQLGVDEGIVAIE